jgi:F0F1-type ATP synthase membrane subunit b/b'
LSFEFRLGVGELAMKDVIERMLRVEEEARTILADAEKDASRAAEAGRREASKRSDKMRLEAHAEATRRRESARAELDRRRAEATVRFDRANEAYAAEVRPRIGEAAERIVRRVLGG